MKQQVTEILALLLSVLTVENVHSAPEVTKISPVQGSLNGGVRVTLTGSGFSNQYNLGSGNEHVSNAVDFISGTQSYPCEIHKDGSTETMIMCYTSPMPEGEYGLRVVVDGEVVSSLCSSNPSKCVYKAVTWRTPTITSVLPRSGPPGTLITVNGMIVTSKYGSNIDESDNGRTEKLLRIYAPQGYKCEMKNNDDFYGIGLDSDTSLNGHFTCKIGGSYVTNGNISYIVEGEWGRALPKLDTLRYSGSNAIYMFQTYAVMDSVSHSSGSVNGGTTITLTGKHFNNTEKPLRVAVDGNDCQNVQLLSDTQMTCETPAQSTAKSLYPGGRGMLYEAWTNTGKSFGTIDEILSLNDTASDYNSSKVDEAYFRDTSNQSFVSRMSGFFIPSYNASHKFFIKCDDYAALYFSSTGDPADKQKVATCSQYTTTYFRRSEQSSTSFDLKAGKPYYIMITHGEYLHGAFVQVAARINTSPITADQSGAAKQEVQTVTVSSTKVNEVQELALANFDSSDENYTPEEQEVQVTGITDQNKQDTYRLGLNGVFTGPIKAESDGTTVKAALNLLPVIAPNSVSVSESSTSTSKTFKITFDFPTGDIDLMDKKIDNSGSSFQVSVSEKKSGKSDRKNVRFQMGQSISPAFTFGASASTVKTVVEGMFSVRCPTTFTSSDNKYFEDFEDQNSVRAMGTILSYVSPFCGRYSIRNPKYVYEAKENKLGISLSQYGHVCFAYLGAINPVLGVNYQYKDKTTLSTESAFGYFSIPGAITSTSWNYVCLNLMDEVSKAKTNGNSFEARKIRVYKLSNSTEDLLVDAVIITRESLVTDTQEGIQKQRYIGAMPGGFTMKSVDVSESNGLYTITMTPNNCSHNIPLLQLANSQASQVTSTSSVFSATSNDGTVSMTTTRTSAASPPVTGSLGFTFEGNSVDIAVDSSEEAVENLIMTIPNIGNIQVKKEGDCAEFTWAVTWLSRKGDLPDATVDGSKLRGQNPTASVANTITGGLYYDPLPGDMLRTPEKTPQVIAFTNDIPARCDGSCNFEWKATQTPTITSIAPTTDFTGQNLVISGSGFSTMISKNKVTIGGVACTVTSATANQIDCTLGAGTGTHNVVVNVEGSGLATGSFSFTYNTQITSFSPSSGSLAGGTKLTLSGFGFAPNAVVSVDGQPATILSSTPLQIECETPPRSAGGVSLALSQYGNSLTAATQFTYSSSLTPTVTSVSRSTSRVTGGETITLQGSGFGASQAAGTKLLIGKTEATISSYSDTQVEATLPANKPGVHSIIFYIDNKGFAKNTASTTSITYTLKVNKIYPTKGSLYGGSIVTVIGEGFGTNGALLTATIGSHSCSVLGTVTDTQFTCQIADTGTTHQINNIGYTWSHKNLNAKVGDFIRWTWTTPAGVSVNIGVYQTATATSDINDGFSSGTAVPNGQFTFQITKAKDMYYWSGYKTKPMRGTVYVTARAQSVEDFSLKMNGFEAEYNTASGVADPANGACTHTAAISGCTSSAATGGTTGKFHFTFDTCWSPSVTAVSHSQGNSVQDIVLTGSGFTSTTCQHKVEIGDQTCTVTNAAASSLTCNVDASTQPVVGVQKNFKVTVSNRGYAIMPTPQVASYVLLPHVSSYTPTDVSRKGGATLTISGGGFSSQTRVEIDSIECKVQSQTYAQLTCITPSMTSPGYKSLVVKVLSNGNNLDAKCSSTLLTCSINYAQSATPTVSQVNPATVSGPSTSLTITGTLFGTSSSDVTVSIGTTSCAVTSVSNTQIQCTVGAVPVGSHDLVVTVNPHGKADTTQKISSPATLTAINPTSGSTNGGTMVTISGNGFVQGKTTVTIGGDSCTISSWVSSSSIHCKTSHTGGAVTGANVAVVSDGSTYSTLSFDFTTTSTPTITGLSPSTGNPGDTLTITGTQFSTSAADVTVTVGDTDCSVTSASATQIQCTLGSRGAGVLAVVASIRGKGDSDKSNTFTYELAATSISATTGSVHGGQTLTVTGKGFSTKDTSVSICGSGCVLDTKGSQSLTQFVCTTPAHAAGPCDVVAKSGTLTSTLTGAYTYDTALSPTITSVNPKYGGTAGGTTVTITGTGFGTSASSVSVKIGGVVCAVQSPVTNTQVKCITGARDGSIDTAVALQVASNGIASQGNAAFSYYDVWSSTKTWVGGTLPAEGELIVISKNQTILLDMTTPTLALILIQGGKLIFDEKDIELNSEYILITDGGHLQVGTEQEPFQHKATIKMHGQFRSKELPIYGSKVLGLREGILDMHGKPTPITWTKLAQTANAGATTITLQHSVNWEVGNSIVLPTTGHRHTQSQNEQRTITAVSPDGKTLTLDSPLTYSHVRVTETYGSTTVDMAGEVGLLSHNVRFEGSSDVAWNQNISKCPDGFNTGEFTTQTCFQGRFGDEMGTDEFGGHILIHAPKPDLDLVIARIEYVELTHVGQAFRLGRYPIHSHLNGDMSKSYVRGCAIHKTYNRAVNVHKTWNFVVEHNVAYNVMGGTFFLEDGIEIGNTFQYNLAVFSKASSSLLNDDITPASFWVTNPNNTIQHNAAAGGTHFGFWYRMHEHPDGPSYDPNICPRHVPLGVFQNNSAHSLGWFGLWVFQEYHPRKNGDCATSAEHETAVFRSLTVWNCEKGAESVNVGATQYNEFVMVHNEKAGYEGKLIKDSPQYNVSSSNGVQDAVIVAKSPGLAADPGSESYCTRGGIVLPYGNGMVVKNVEFYNFDQTGCNSFTFTKIDGTCSDQCGGYTYHMYEITFTNSPNHGKYDWLWQGVLIDKDGSLTGTAGSQVIPKNDNLPSSCTQIASFSQSVDASLCPSSLKFHRLALKGVEPVSLEAKNLIITNTHGSAKGPFMTKRISHKPGWVLILIDGYTYNFKWEGAEHITNISYVATFYLFENPTDHVIVCQKMEREPDRFFYDGNTPRDMSANPLAISANKDGDWYFDSTKSEMCYIVAGKQSRRRKRGSGAMPVYFFDRNAIMKAYKCYYTNCTAPPDPDTIPPSCNSRPANATLWSDSTTWRTAESGWGGNKGNGVFGLPVQGDKVKIPKDQWVVLNGPIPSFERLVIEGTLELDHGTNKDADITIDVTYLYILGGRLIIGCDESSPYEGKAKILLRGDHSTAPYPVTEGPNVGSKVIAVFGGLDLHGKDVGVTWTTLAQTAAKGDSQIVLTDQVNWAANDEIVITATSYEIHQVEIFSITSIAADKKTITLNSSLAHKHISFEETLSTGEKYSMKAEVGLLTRNIIIEGAEYANMYKEAYGARVLVGVSADPTRRYTGYARLSNVEFYKAAQEGYVAPYDPRHAISFLDIPVSNIKPCYVKKSSFHHGFGVAVGVFGTDNLPIEGNVIHSTVGSAIYTKSSGTIIRNNLFTLNYWPGSYMGRRESMNIDYDGTIDAVGASGTILQGNAVSSSERSGYHGDLESCSATETWTNNIFHSNVMGVGIFPTDKPTVASCMRWANMTVWRNYKFGVYYNSFYDPIFTRLTLVENGVGLFPFVVGPSALAHQYANRLIAVSDSIVVGKSSSFDCATDIVADLTQGYWSLRSHYDQSWRINTYGRVGVAMPTFSQGINNAPEKPFKGIMAYNAIGGLMTVKDTTFAHWKTSTQANCGSDYAIGTNPSNDDLIHPLRVTNIKKDNVDNKAYYNRPNVGKVNPSDCVDMDCDGFKKCLLQDTDGSFFGTAGTMVPHSEWEWDGDPRRGLGDYRIPKTMLTDPTGKVHAKDDWMKYDGILRDDTCTLDNNAHGYYCTDYDYQLMVIESLDDDTELRRLSPVGLLGHNDKGDGFIDLINGPQDHGWCAGYTCQKRLSTFHAVVATGRNYSVYFTSTSPQKLRYMLLNTPNNKRVRVNTHHTAPNRLDVYRNGAYILPKNGRLDSNQNLIQDQATSPGQYTPNVVSDSCGDNYMDRDWQEMQLILCGGDEVEIRLSPQILVAFNVPTMTVDQYFGPNLLNNLALFLGIPSSKVRTMKVQSGVNKRRRKRSGPNTMYYIEVGNPPCSDVNCTAAISQMSYTDQQNLASQVINQYQLGNLSDILNITINGVSVAEALPPTSDPNWATVLAATDYLNVLKVPRTLVFQTEANTGSEGNAFQIQPKLRMNDDSGNAVPMLGATSAPWQVQATLRAGSGSNILATLVGNTTVSFVDGWANFTDLGISHSGSGYILDFTIIYPASSNFTVASSPLSVTPRPLTSGVTQSSSDVYLGSTHGITIDIRDSGTGVALSDIAWSGLQWYVNVSLVTGSSYTGAMTAPSTVAFNPVTGLATISGIMLDTVGMAHLKLAVYSVPSQYSYEISHGLMLYPTEFQSVTIDTTITIQVKFDLDFAIYGNEQFAAVVFNEFQPNFPLTKLYNLQVSQGSVVVTMTVSGNTTSVAGVVSAVCDSITSGKTFTYGGTTVTMAQYMTVNGATYYGVSCSDTTDDHKKSETRALMIAGICIAVLLFILIVTAIVVWRCKVYPKTKTHRFTVYDHDPCFEGMDRDAVFVGKGRGTFFFEDNFYRQNTFDSMGQFSSRENSFLEEKQRPPVNTIFFSEKGGIHGPALSGHF